MSSDLKNLAVQKALENSWKEACDLNLKILEEDPDDIDSLNRLAFAYMKQADFKHAKSTYKKVTEIDRSNPIAIKNLKKLEMMSLQKDANPNKKIDIPMHAADLFIEEAGRTKTVELKNIAERKTLSFFQPGDAVNLVIKRSKIFVQSFDHEFLGMLPDSIGSRILPLMQGGNDYEAYIKAITDKSVTVFVREIKRAARFRNQASFSNIFSPLSADSGK